MNNVKECVLYFRSVPTWNRMMVEMRKKYKSYGRAGGFVILNDATRFECEAAQKFFGTFFKTPHIKFSLKQFEDTLQETAFKGVQLQRLLEEYFGSALISNKESRLNQEREKQEFLLRFEKAYPDQEIYSWIEAMRVQKGYGYQLVVTELEISKSNISSVLKNVCDAVNLLCRNKDKTHPLAVFSAQVTADPHYFDREKLAGRLLLHVLSFLQEKTFPRSMEDVLEVYYQSCIMPDNISSFTAQIGLQLMRNGREHPSYKYFREYGEECLLAVSNLNNIDGADCGTKKVYIVENQMVFSHLCKVVREQKASLVCTSGHLKTASYLLLDLLFKSGCNMYYSGDFDPEGVLIADKLLRRYEGQLHLWRFSLEDYNSISYSNEIDTTRLAKLNQIKHKDLLRLTEEMKRVGRSAYQELLLDKLENDIKN